MMAAAAMIAAAAVVVAVAVAVAVVAVVVSEMIVEAVEVREGNLEVASDVVEVVGLAEVVPIPVSSNALRSPLRKV